MAEKVQYVVADSEAASEVLAHRTTSRDPAICNTSIAIQRHSTHQRRSCYAQRLLRVLTNMPQEFTGTLTGFDDYVNMVLEDVTE